jgi:hypothetical protein
MCTLNNSRVGSNCHSKTIFVRISISEVRLYCWAFVRNGTYLHFTITVWAAAHRTISSITQWYTQISYSQKQRFTSALSSFSLIILKFYSPNVKRFKKIYYLLIIIFFTFKTIMYKYIILLTYSLLIKCWRQAQSCVLLPTQKCSSYQENTIISTTGGTIKKRQNGRKSPVSILLKNWIIICKHIQSVNELEVYYFQIQGDIFSFIFHATNITTKYYNLYSTHDIQKKIIFL